MSRVSSNFLNFGNYSLHLKNRVQFHFSKIFVLNNLANEKIIESKLINLKKSPSLIYYYYYYYTN